MSTRGAAPELGFEDVLLTGLARDGGLYVPEKWPAFTATEISAMAGKSYTNVAYQVMAPFVDEEVPERELRAMIEDAYASFRHEAVTPLVQLSPGDWLLELFHGPTLAFKDIAMQVLGQLMDRALKARGEKATIIAATSGDTGGAAIEAFRGREAIDIFVLFPKGRVSDVQRRQMTTPSDANVHTIALEGHFDDCQDMVKALFNDHAFRDSVRLAGVNSINWGRIMAQVVYYFTAAIALGAPQRKISFTVPTGNFGDVFAGFVAKKMGLPIDQLIIATNENDILDRVIKTGRYEVTGVKATASPSMDIQVSSNFERLLFEATGRDSQAVSRLMEGLKQSGSFTLEPVVLDAIQSEFQSGSCSEEATLDTIKSMLSDFDMTVDPHTAVALHAAAAAPRNAAVPMVVLSTAHPAKFPDAIAAALGASPPEPEVVASQRGAVERFEILANDQEVVADYIKSHSRVADISAQRR